MRATQKCGRPVPSRWTSNRSASGSSAGQQRQPARRPTRGAARRPARRSGRRGPRLRCSHGSSTIVDRLARPSSKRIARGLVRCPVAAEPRQHRVDRLRDSGTRAAGRHRRLDLHEPAQPARRQVDLLLAVGRRRRAGVRPQPGGSTRSASGGTSAGPGSGGTAPTSSRRWWCRVRRRRHGRSRRPVDGQAAVARLVAEKHSKKTTSSATVMTGSHGNEQPPQLGVVATEVVGVFQPGVPVPLPRRWNVCARSGGTGSAWRREDRRRSPGGPSPGGRLAGGVARPASTGGSRPCLFS